jgi:glycosyltransferase involved in cell wall biosynthesis
MKPSDALVSVGLPVRNGADRIGDVVRSVLAQDHSHIELVICDNASTDNTADVCRELLRTDRRIVYHRHQHNVGILNNFISAIQIARGAYFRWIGDDDWLAPDFVSRTLECFAEDERRLIVTTRVEYMSTDGVLRPGESYDGARMASLDPVERFVEVMHLLSESWLIDPLYALVRREPVAAIPRRNMLGEDELFAARLALAGPWGHVPLTVARRNIKFERSARLADRLGVPRWQVYVATILQYREILGWINQTPLADDQKRQARTVVRQTYLRRYPRTCVHRGRKLRQLTASTVGHLARARPTANR